MKVYSVLNIVWYTLNYLLKCFTNTYSVTLRHAKMNLSESID